MSRSHGGIVLGLLLAWAGISLAAADAGDGTRYTLSSREVTVGMGEATANSHVRQFVSREVTVGMGEATANSHVRQFVSREVTVGMGEATANSHVRLYVSREYTAGLGPETLRLLPEDPYVQGTVRLSLEDGFVQNPLELSCSWSIRRDGKHLTGASGLTWEEFKGFSATWDTTKNQDGAYDVEFRFRRPHRADVVVSRRYHVLNSCVIHRNETISALNTWKNDGRVHVVIGALTITGRGWLTIKPGTVVKFVDGGSLAVQANGRLEAKGVTLTHFADDDEGGDTNGDGSQTFPRYGAYTFDLDKQAQIVEDDDTKVYFLNGEGYYRNYALQPGWNLISVPFDILRKWGGGELWQLSPFEVDMTTGRMQPIGDRLLAGSAVWVYSPEARTIQAWSVWPVSDTASLPQLESGWNLAGISADRNSSFSVWRLGVTAVWRWLDGRYQSVPIRSTGYVTLEPGVGYWFHVSDE